MSIITNNDIAIAPLLVKIVDPVRGAIDLFTDVPHARTREPIIVLQYDEALQSILGVEPTCSQLLSVAETSKSPLFWSCFVYLHQRDELYTTSDLLRPASASQYPAVLLSRVKLRRTDRLSGRNDVVSVSWGKMRPPDGVDRPRGGINYHVGQDDEGILFCATGGPTGVTAGIYHVPRRSATVQPLVKGYYGTAFNSPSDVVTTADGALWFTDPHWGHARGVRPTPALPPAVYRFEPASGAIKVVADDLRQPTSLAFSPDESVLYITEMAVGEEYMKRGAIYAYTVALYPSLSGPPSGPFLTNKRIFAFAVDGRVDGVKCDADGNVYAATGAGIDVWNAGGKLIGRIMVNAGVSRFCFGKDGEMFLGNGEELWRLQLAHGTRDAMLASPKSGSAVKATVDE